MIINGALLLLIRSTSTALLAMVGTKWLVAYFVSDMSLYLVYKAVRRDLRHWFPFYGKLEKLS
jgi:hypothetical protein